MIIATYFSISSTTKPIDMPSPTLAEVIIQLRGIVENCTAKNSRNGLFAYVYYRTTLAIEEAIANKVFEDNARMERFDIAFAQLYLKAYAQATSGQKASKAWQAAFEAETMPLTILQHILLGMNAHINLDLGVAASQIMEGQEIAALEKDFFLVNTILAGIVKELQQRIGKVSPLLFLLDWIGGRKDEQLINFSMAKARAYAWRLSKELAATSTQPAQQQRMSAADDMAYLLARGIIRPPGRWLAFGLQLISRMEEKNIGQAIQAMGR